MSDLEVTIVVAIAANGVIGRDGGLPWRLPSDLARFKALTMGHTLIMGRRTWESIGRVLPGRRSIVVSRRGLVVPAEVTVVSSLPAAIASARAAGESRAFVVGGASLYAEALTLADRAVVTWVAGDADGDVVFPQVDWSTWTAVRRQVVAAAAGDERAFEVVEYRSPRAVGLANGGLA